MAKKHARRPVPRARRQIGNQAPRDVQSPPAPDDPWDVAEHQLKIALKATEVAEGAAADAEWQALQAEHAARWALIEAEGLVQIARAQYEAARALTRIDSEADGSDEAEDAAYRAGELQLLDSQDEVLRARQRQRN